MANTKVATQSATQPSLKAPQPVWLSRRATTIDLHGMTVQDAYTGVLEQIDHWHGKRKNLTFITGKSGQIRQEFETWVLGHAKVRRVEVINGGGAFRVYFRSRLSNFRPPGQELL